MADIVKLKPENARHDNKDQCLIPADRWGECRHDRSIVDERKTEVTCADCGEKLNPIWVLSQLANKESGWFRSRDRYQDEMKRLEERSRTRCQKCGYMTRISRR